MRKASIKQSDKSSIMQIDRLNERNIKSYLNTSVLGHTINIFQSIDSTNIAAKEMAQKGAFNGTLVLAEEQTVGKGRLDRHWISPPYKGIWMSLILRPTILPQYAYNITVMLALAVVDAVKRVYGTHVSIKWPNDIIANSKKICGILTEMCLCTSDTNPDINNSDSTSLSSTDNAIEYIIAGVGLNVNLTAKDFPREIRKTASSLLIETGKKCDRNKIVAEILNSLEELIRRYESEGFVAILKDYKSNCITINKRVKIVGALGDFIGTATDITDVGELVVRLDNGEIRNVISGDVSVRGIAGYV